MQALSIVVLCHTLYYSLILSCHTKGPAVNSLRSQLYREVPEPIGTPSLRPWLIYQANYIPIHNIILVINIEILKTSDNAVNYMVLFGSFNLSISECFCISFIVAHP